MNPGQFVLISLFPSSVYWQESQRNRFFREYWNLEYKQTKYDVGGPNGSVKQVKLVHVDRGPLYNRWGSSGVLDYDTQTRIPIYLQPLKFDQVMGGRIVYEIPLAVKTAEKTKRQLEQDARDRREQTVRDARGIIDSAAKDIGNEMWWRANQTGADSGTANTTRDYSHIHAVNSGFEEAVLTAEDVA